MCYFFIKNVFSVDSKIFFCNSFISFVNFCSCELVSFFLYVAYFIISILIVPLSSYHFLFEFAYFFYFSYAFLNCFLIILIQQTTVVKFEIARPTSKIYKVDV